MTSTGEKCEDCGELLEAEFVDIGIGWEQVTKELCPNNCEYVRWIEKNKATHVKSELKHRLDELKKELNLNWKDELKVLGLLLDDLSVSMPAVPSLTITSTKK